MFCAQDQAHAFPRFLPQTKGEILSLFLNFLNGKHELSMSMYFFKNEIKIFRANYPRGVLKGFGRNSRNEPLTNVMEGGKLVKGTVCLS